MPDQIPLRLRRPSRKVLRLFLDRPAGTRLTGYDIYHQARVFTGTLYPMLLRFEAAGWLESEWEDINPAEAGRPRRRYYWLTPVGKAQAEAALGALVSEN